MTITPDESPDIMLLLACRALEESWVPVRLFNHHELVYHGEILSVDLIEGTILIRDADVETLIRTSDFTRIEIY